MSESLNLSATIILIPRVIHPNFNAKHLAVVNHGRRYVECLSCQVCCSNPVPPVAFARSDGGPFEDSRRTVSPYLDGMQSRRRWRSRWKHLPKQVDDEGHDPGNERNDNHDR